MQAVGYKQSKEYFNSELKAYKLIGDVSSICISRYNPNKKITTSEEFLKQPKRYCFNLVVPIDQFSAEKHIYYYDSKAKAIENHKKIKTQLYDQLTKPFLNKIKVGRRLTLNDEERLLEILNKF